MSENNWFEQMFNFGQPKEKEKPKDQDLNEDEPSDFEKDPDVPDQPSTVEQKPELFGFLKDWQNNIFNKPEEQKPVIVEQPVEVEAKFEEDPDVLEPIQEQKPAEQNPELFAFLKEWQDNLFNNGGAKKPTENREEKPKETPKLPPNNDLIGTWWRRFTLSQFGVGMPSVPPQILTDLKLMRAKEIHELDEAIADTEKYHQRLQKKVISVGKRIEQLKAERARLQMLKDTTQLPKKPETEVKPSRENKDKNDKKDSTPLNQR